MPKVGVKQKKTESGTDAKLNRNCCAVEHAREVRGDCKPLQINWLATLLAGQREVPAGDYNPLRSSHSIKGIEGRMCRT